MIVSRNPVEYLKRKGLVDEPARPSPRLDVDALLVHTIPLTSPPRPTQAVLETFEGEPPPDRGTARPWPAQLEPNPE